MKRVAIFMAILSILLLACKIPAIAIPGGTTAVPPTSDITTATLPAPASQTPTVIEPTVAPETPTPETPTPDALPTATELPVSTGLPAAQPNVLCNELELFLDPALASGYNCETVPASTEGMELNPQYTRLTLQGYTLSDKFFPPQISVFPVQAFSELLPENIPNEVAVLQSLVSGGAPGDSALPFLPIFNAAQVFRAQYRALPFTNGNGIRYMTLFAQYFAPINNHDLFYTYQGLTSDGLYWVSAILPINNPILPANGDNPPGGVSWEQFGNDYSSYISDMTNQLNSQAAGSFTPTLAALDSLVTSIRVRP